MSCWNVHYVRLCFPDLGLNSVKGDYSNTFWNLLFRNKMDSTEKDRKAHQYWMKLKDSLSSLSAPVSH